MDGYISVSLQKALNMEEVGESKVEAVLSNFSCPYNKDIENFIRQKAIIFSRNGWAQTQLVFTSYKNEPVLVGFFTLALKTITISSSKISNTLKSKIRVECGF